MINTIRKSASSISDSVHERIQKEDPWYVSSQFEWAEKPGIKQIYDRRAKYFLDCIQKAQARLGSELTMLDAGCGDGYWLARLQGRDGLKLIGVDYNPLRVERAKRFAAQAHVIQSDLKDIILLEKQFDIVLLNQVIEHIVDDLRILQVIRSVIRPGGVMILGTPNEGSRLHQWSLRWSGGLKTTDHVHFYTEPEIRNKIVQSGFIIDSVMREVFYPGQDRLYYGLLARPWGFRLLEWMTKFWPTECSDYYFECKLSD